MSSPHDPEAFKIEAVKQVTELGRPVADVEKALCVSSPWLKQHGKPEGLRHEKSALQAAIRQVTEERNILKEATTVYFASESRKGISAVRVITAAKPRWLRPTR